MQINFIKMHGCGNDFVVIDNRDINIELNSDQIIQLADYKRSIGFEQLLLVNHSDIADIGVRFFNNDGKEINACGNGSRCLASLMLAELGKSEVTISTVNRILHAHMDDRKLGWVSINMGIANVKEHNIIFNCGEVIFTGSFVDIGNPHIVILNHLDNSLENANLLKYGKAIEEDQRFAAQVNVNFVRVKNRNFIELQTWERGAGATLACGTGACASFSALRSLNLVDYQVIIKQPGGEVMVSIASEGNLWLSGPAVISYQGKVEING